MSEDELIKSLKKKMNICVILQRKFGCRCVKSDVLPFCTAVEELYAECVTIKS